MQTLNNNSLFTNCNSICIKSILFLLIIIFAGAGCGYKFSGGGTLPSGTGVICISVFKNRSSETRLENTIVNDLIYEFTRNGQKITNNEAEADSLLTGEIKSVSSETVTHTGSLTSIESRLTVVVDIYLRDHKGRVLWEGRNLRGNEVYAVDSENQQNSAKKQAAFKKLSVRFASTVYAGMTENF